MEIFPSFGFSVVFMLHFAVSDSPIVSTTVASDVSVIFRFKFTASSIKHYPAWDDIHSLEFKQVGHVIAEQVTAIFHDAPGSRTVTVERLKKLENGVEITVHLVSTVLLDEILIRQRIEKALEKGFLGHIEVSLEGFTFGATNESATKTSKWQCERDNYWCRDGSCIDQAGKCDKIKDCADRSDEDNCEETLVEVIARPASLVVEVGQRAQFYCGSADFKHGVKWYRRGRVIDSVRRPHIRQTKGRLQFVRVSRSDSGEYMCRANAIEGFSTTVKLTVTPRSTTEHSSTDSDAELEVALVNVTEVSPVELICDLHGAEAFSPANWTKVYGRLPDGSTVNGSTLRIPKIRLEDSGFYECHASTAHSDEDPNTIAQILVRRAQTITGTVEFRRRFFPRLSVDNVTIDEGDPFSFQCISTKPHYNVLWTRDSALYMSSYVTIMGGNLTSLTSEPADAGPYYCNHRAGSVTERMTAFLAVLPRKYPTVMPLNLIVEEGDPFEFTCISSRDDVNVHWSRKDYPVSDGIAITNGQLAGKFAGLNDQGEYKCGHVGRPKEQTASYLTITPLKFPVVTPSNVTVEEGDPFEFTCISSRVDIDVQWSRKDPPMPDGVIVTNGQLAGKSAYLKDHGEYKCGHVGRPKEQTTGYLTVTPLKFPVVEVTTGILTDLIIKDESIHLVIVNVTEGELFEAKCSSSRDGADVEWTRANQSTYPGSGMSEKLLNFQSATIPDAGEYFCGHKGRGKENVTLRLTVLPRKYPVIQFNGEPISVPFANVTVNEGDPYKFDCNSTREGNNVKWILLSTSLADETIRIFSASKNDTGEYRCSHIGRNKEISTINLTVLPLQYPVLEISTNSTANFTLYKDDTSVTAEPSYGLALDEGENLTIHCRSTRENVSVSWHLGNDLSENFTIDAKHGLLFSEAVGRQDAGKFDCGHVGFPRESTFLSVTVLPLKFPTIRSFHLSLTERDLEPEFSDDVTAPSALFVSQRSQPSNITVTEGDEVGIQCLSTRNETATEWTRENQPFSPTLRSAAQNLTASSVRISDGGLYFCGHVGRIRERTPLHLNVLPRRYPTVTWTGHVSQTVETPDDSFLREWADLPPVVDDDEEDALWDLEDGHDGAMDNLGLLGEDEGRKMSAKRDVIPFGQPGLSGDNAAATGSGEASVKFRFTVNMTSIKYFPELGDLDSLDFKLVGHEISERITALFQDRPGTRTVVVERFDPTPEGVMATIHITSTVFVDPFEIESRIKVAVSVSHHLGRFTTAGTGFTFEPTEQPANKTERWKCPDNSFWCSDGGCSPLPTTCDGNADCDDGSDEAICEPTLVEVEAHPKLLTIQAGHRAQFYCGSKDLRHRVKWFRNGINIDVLGLPNVVQKKGRLQIVRATKADAGEYVCTAQLALPGSSISANLLVIPRTINGTAADIDEDVSVSLVNGTEGAGATITCSVDGEEDAKVNWIKMDGLLPASAITSGSSLEIPSLALRDEGFYECRPASADPTDEPTSVAQILVRPAQKIVAALTTRKRFMPKVLPGNVTVIEGESFAFQCISTKKGADVNWARSGHKIPDHLLNVGGNLSSEAALVSDAGKYYCRHKKGTAAERVFVTLTVEAKEYPKVVPVRLHVSEEEPYSFKCDSTRDGVEVEWTRVGASLPAGVSVLGGNLSSASASKNDSGEYHCSHVGRKGEQTIIHLTVMPFQFPVIQILRPTKGELTELGALSLIPTPGGTYSFTLTEGDELRVLCSSARDNVTVEWSRSHLSIPSDFLMEHGSLSGSAVKLNDSGKYYCRHVGWKGERTAFEITVIARKYPTIVGLGFSWEKSTFSSDIKDSQTEYFSSIFSADKGGSVRVFNVSITAGEPFGFMCQASREGAALHWIRNDQRWPSVGTKISRRDGRLTSVSATTKDAGEYHCEHVGKKGERTTINLVILPRKFPTIQPINGSPSKEEFYASLAGQGIRRPGSDDEDVGQSFNVSVTEGQSFGYQCSSARDGVSVLWTRNGKPLSQDFVNADGKLICSAVSLNDGGQYSCEHVGKKGEQTWIYLTVLQKQYPTIRPSNPYVSDGVQALEEEAFTAEFERTKRKPDQPIIVSVTQGESFGYQCTSARGDGSVAWTRKGRTMPSSFINFSGNLNSQSVTADDAGEYYCDHVGRSGERTTINLVILDKKYPVIRPLKVAPATSQSTTEKKTQTATGGKGQDDGTFTAIFDTAIWVPGQAVKITVFEGESFGFQCSASRDGSTVQWAREEQPLSARFSNADGKLICSSVGLDDAGRYFCEHAGRAGERSWIYLTVAERKYPIIQLLEFSAVKREFTVAVGVVPGGQSSSHQNIPEYPRNRGFNVTVNEGAPFGFQCTASRSASRVEWTRKDQPLPAKAVNSEGKLTLFSASVGDTGEYYCDHAGQTGERTPIYVTVLARKYPVQFFTVMVGESFHYQCTATRGNVPVVWMRHGGEALPEGVTVKDQILSSQNATVEQGGLYSCGHLNVEGEWTVIHITVKDPLLQKNEKTYVKRPKLFPTLKARNLKTQAVENLSTVTAGNMGAPFYNLTVTEGRSFAYQCVSSRSGVGVELGRTGGPFSAGVRVVDGGLTSDSASAEDTGAYYCGHAGSNGERISVYLTVTEAPEAKKCTVELGKNYYHIVIPASLELVVTEGDSFAFECIPTHPGLRVKWARDGLPLPSTMSVKDGVLTSDSANIHDTGAYYCSHAKRKGEKVTAYLTVLPAVSASVNYTVIEGDAFAFQCNSTKSGVHVEWSRLHHDIPPTVMKTAGYLTSESAQLSDTGVYICRHQIGSIYERVLVYLSVVPRRPMSSRAGRSVDRLTSPTAVTYGCLSIGLACIHRKV